MIKIKEFISKNYFILYLLSVLTIILHMIYRLNMVFTI